MSDSDSTPPEGGLVDAFDEKISNLLRSEVAAAGAKFEALRELQEILLIANRPQSTWRELLGVWRKRRPPLWFNQPFVTFLVPLIVVFALLVLRPPWKSLEDMRQTSAVLVDSVASATVLVDTTTNAAVSPTTAPWLMVLVFAGTGIIVLLLSAGLTLNMLFRRHGWMAGFIATVPLYLLVPLAGLLERTLPPVYFAVVGASLLGIGYALSVSFFATCGWCLVFSFSAFQTQRGRLQRFLVIRLFELLYDPELQQNWEERRNVKGGLAHRRRLRRWFHEHYVRGPSDPVIRRARALEQCAEAIMFIQPPSGVDDDPDIRPWVRSCLFHWSNQLRLAKRLLFLPADDQEDYRKEVRAVLRCALTWNWLIREPSFEAAPEGRLPVVVRLAAAAALIIGGLVITQAVSEAAAPDWARAALSALMSFLTVTLLAAAAPQASGSLSQMRYYGGASD